MSVYKKILEVMKDVEYLQKDDQVAFGNTKYKAISEEKVTSTIRASLVKNGIVIIPVKQEHRKEHIGDQTKYNYLTTVDVTYRIVDTDTGDFIEAVSSGTGVDTQDKGVGKAMTYAYKYLLLRTFAIPTGDDPDKISSAELDAKQSNELKQKIVDEMNKSQANKQENKVTKATLKAKFKLCGYDEKRFDEWFDTKAKSGMTEKQMDAGLTQVMVEKKKAV